MAGGTTIGNLFVDLIARTANFERGMARAQKTMVVMAAKFKRFSRRMAGIGRTMATSITLPAGLLGIAVLKSAGDFEAAMKIVEAKTKATGVQLEALRERAKELGRTTQFSATQAANGLVILAQAGFTAEQAFHALPEVLNFAAASGRDLAGAAGTIADTMGQFGLEVKDARRISDVFVKAANSANQTVEDLGESMKFGGLVAKEFGLGLEDTVAAMTLMAKAALRGTLAGTTFRGAMVGLVNASAEGEAIFEKLGVRVFDSQGNFRGFIKVVEELSAAGINAQQVMKVFGKRAGPGMLKIFREGAPAIRSLSKALKESAGESAREAAKRMEGFNGAMLRLVSALEGLAIAIADAGILDFMTELITKLANFVSNMAEVNPELLKWAAASVAVLAALGPLLMVVGQLGVMLAVLAPLLTPVVAAMALFAAKALLAVVALGLMFFAVKKVSDWFNDRGLFGTIEDVASLADPVINALDRARKAIENSDFMKKLQEFTAEVKGKFTQLGTDVVEALKGIPSYMKNQFMKDMWKAVELLKKPIDKATGFFKDMYNRVVGGSYVPDMAEGVMKTFGEMALWMKDKTLSATGAVSDAFAAMGDKVTTTFGDTLKKLRDKMAALFKKKKKGPGAEAFEGDGAGGPKPPGEEPPEEKVRRVSDALLTLRAAGKQVGEALTQSLGGALDSFVEKGKFSMREFKNLASSALRDLSKQFLRRGILGAGGGGGGGLLGGIGKLFGFQRGGSFKVAGAGGADSQLVAFRATPGEEVSVRRPDQMAGGSVTVNQNFALGVGAQVRAELQRERPAMLEGIKASVADARMRGGSFSRGMGR